VRKLYCGINKPAANKKAGLRHIFIIYPCLCPKEFKLNILNPNMPALLIGFDPPGEVCKEIYRLKSRVKEACGQQQQVDEPPHCTFVVNNFSDIKAVDDILKSVCLGFSPLDISMKNITYFPPEKNKAWMVHAAIERNIRLQELQKEVIDKTSAFRQGCLLCDYLQRNIPDYQYSEEEKKDIQQYGYPYVGANWQAHISVAILDEGAFKKIGKELTGTAFQHKFKLKEITLFIYTDKWVPYKTYKLCK